MNNHFHSYSFFFWYWLSTYGLPIYVTSYWNLVNRTRTRHIMVMFAFVCRNNNSWIMWWPLNMFLDRASSIWAPVVTPIKKRQQYYIKKKGQKLTFVWFAVFEASRCFTTKENFYVNAWTTRTLSWRICSTILDKPSGNYHLFISMQYVSLTINMFQCLWINNHCQTILFKHFFLVSIIENLRTTKIL